MKWMFRRIVLRKKLDKERIKLTEIVREVASEPSQELLKRCALNGWKVLKQEVERIQRK
jgi:hypothetical protein